MCIRDRYQRRVRGAEVPSMSTDKTRARLREICSGIRTVKPAIPHSGRSAPGQPDPAPAQCCPATGRLKELTEVCSNFVRRTQATELVEVRSVSCEEAINVFDRMADAWQEGHREAMDPPECLAAWEHPLWVEYCDVCRA
eukprot:TRINITY_DN34614_c0_g1_i2.p1 TRINITY_DN34614_c0_g1~~TRINITY_DN34614_c0_g1_i2.p1  ORF type:complete len:140 (+),score=18.89 TRINITY_DN34614_c0_g1_i2:106-525(+)